MSELEIWKPIREWEMYEVSNSGKVRRANRELTLQMTIHGYMRANLWDGKRHKGAVVHRLVLTAFHRKPKPKEMACHLNGCRADNRIENLKWGTMKENYAHAVSHGTAPRHDRHGCAKLTSDIAVQIRSDYKRTSYHKSNCLELANRYGVSKFIIQEIVKGKLWRDAELIKLARGEA